MRFGHRPGVKSALEQTPPELSADILDKGIVMTGGVPAAQLDERIRQETNLPVNVIDNPLQCVCMGTAKIVENLDTTARCCSTAPLRIHGADFALVGRQAVKGGS